MPARPAIRLGIDHYVLMVVPTTASVAQRVLLARAVWMTDGLLIDLLPAFISKPPGPRRHTASLAIAPNGLDIPTSDSPGRIRALKHLYTLATSMFQTGAHVLHRRVPPSAIGKYGNALSSRGRLPASGGPGEA